MVVWPQPITCEQSPDILAVRPQEQVVAAQAVRVFRQSSGGFVDSHNQVARMSFSQGCVLEESVSTLTCVVSETLLPA